MRLRLTEPFAASSKFSVSALTLYNSFSCIDGSELPLVDGSGFASTNYADAVRVMTNKPNGSHTWQPSDAAQPTVYIGAELASNYSKPLNSASVVPDCFVWHQARKTQPFGQLD